MKEKKSVYDMELHDMVKINDGLMIFRVSGGWIYAFNNCNEYGNSISTCFVPYSTEFSGDTIS